MEWFKGLLKLAFTAYRAYRGDPIAAKELLDAALEKARELK